jgi:hypothetical protein
VADTDGSLTATVTATGSIPDSQRGTGPASRRSGARTASVPGAVRRLKSDGHCLAGVVWVGPRGVQDTVSVLVSFAGAYRPSRRAGDHRS